MSAGVELDHVTVRFGHFTAVDNATLDIKGGEFFSFLGPSGCGKTTILRTVSCFLDPSEGHVRIGGEEIYRMSESRRAKWRGHNVGIVFQFFQLLPTLSLLENTILPMDYCNVYRYQERPERAMALLRMVGLGEHALDLPANLSNGQQQAAAIARSLATDPPIIVADEPTGNLDSRSADVVIRVFQELAAQGKTILIVTHDPSLTSRTDRTIIIADGEIIDPIVAGALPSLDHGHMLQVTHELQRKRYGPGEIIIRQGEPVNGFYMVGSGQAEVWNGHPTLSVAQLSRNQYCGEVELFGDEKAIATVRAGTSPVELGILSRDRFAALMQESPATASLLASVAEARRQENLARGPLGGPR